MYSLARVLQLTALVLAVSGAQLSGASAEPITASQSCASLAAEIARLNVQIRSIAQERATLQQQVMQLLAQAGELGPASREAQAIQQQMAALQAQDRSLGQQHATLNARLQAAVTDYATQCL